MPYYPQTDNKAIPFEMRTRAEKLVIDYTGLSLAEVMELDLFDFLYLEREAYIFNLSQTDEGREYLQNCYRIKQTKPDRAAVREKMNK